jgi:hypothetical protein
LGVDKKWFQNLRSRSRVPLQRDYISIIKALMYASSAGRCKSAGPPEAG